MRNAFLHELEAHNEVGACRYVEWASPSIWDFGKYETHDINEVALHVTL
jgi:hypothetical protein